MTEQKEIELFHIKSLIIKYRGAIAEIKNAIRFDKSEASKRFLTYRLSMLKIICTDLENSKASILQEIRFWNEFTSQINVVEND